MTTAALRYVAAATTSVRGTHVTHNPYRECTQYSLYGRGCVDDREIIRVGCSACSLQLLISGEASFCRVVQAGVCVYINHGEPRSAAFHAGRGARLRFLCDVVSCDRLHPLE